MSDARESVSAFECNAKRRRFIATRPSFRWFPLALIAASTLLAAGLGFNPKALGQPKDNDRDQVWIATWGASPVAPVGANAANPGFTNQTVRLVLRTSIGGNEVRVRVSNAFGSDSLNIGAAHIALRDKDAKIVAGTDRVLTFGDSRSTTIPAGALVVSDSVKLAVPALSDVAVSLYLPGPTGPATWHPLARATNYISTPGDFTQNAEMPIDHTVPSWFYLTDVEVKASKDTLAIVTLGDSITDGNLSTVDSNHRWPNFLAERLAAAHMKLSVVDEGIAGNRLLHDLAGPNGLARFDRDVLAQPGVGYVTVMLGINDIGRSTTGQPPQPVTADEMIAGDQQMVLRAHQLGLKIIGCTMTPYEGANYFAADGEVKRQSVNKFVRSSSAYDGIIDFDAVVRDPSHPARLLPMFDSGDHLHPNDAGYKAMADSINLSLFRHRPG
jgi:lysophospholipase L1-like esterase